MTGQEEIWSQDWEESGQKLEKANPLQKEKSDLCFLAWQHPWGQCLTPKSIPVWKYLTHLHQAAVCVPILVPTDSTRLALANHWPFQLIYQYQLGL